MMRHDDDIRMNILLRQDGLLLRLADIARHERRVMRPLNAQNAAQGVRFSRPLLALS